MDLGQDEQKAIFSKSLALINKTYDQIEHIDQIQFPTEGTSLARKQLLEILDKIREPTVLRSVDPDVLYKALLSVQSLVELVKHSSVSQISWPFVQFCDKIWHSFFPSEESVIFYSVTAEHNYCISEFSKRLGEIMEGILPQNEINIFTSRQIFCLQLASVEDYNLPLYAIIGHEFGHALYSATRNQRNADLAVNAVPLLALFVSDLVSIDRSQAYRRLGRMIPILTNLAEEMFCDMVGLFVMGPAFLLSFYELTWSENKNLSIILLTDDEDSTIAYPSHLFRLWSIKKSLNIDAYCASEVVQEHIRKLDGPLRNCLTCFTSIPCNHSGDMVRVIPESDNDSVVFEQIFNRRSAEIKEFLQTFVSNCLVWFGQHFSEMKYKMKSDEIVALLQRLHNKVIPNIIRIDAQKDLLGYPADLKSIINAAALYRLYLLVDDPARSNDETPRSTSIAERLTSKAMEVAYIHKEYNTSQ